MTEIEGNVLHNDYKVRKLTQALSEKDSEIKTLHSLIEETKRQAEMELLKKDEKIEHLTRSLKFYKGRVQPRKKALVETKAESLGDAQESAE